MTPPDGGGAASASELGGVALHILMNSEARTVAEGHRRLCEVSGRDCEGGAGVA
jgi:hypothetical protein